MISFVTCIKLMPGYEHYTDKLKLYVESILAACPFSFEILIVEEICSRNVAFVSDSLSPEWFAANNARLIPYHATYANPHGYNMIEAYAKNAGIKQAKYPYICVTNADIVFDPVFFTFKLEPNIFYRFLMYETELTSLDTIFTSPARLINSDLLSESNWTLKALAYKSGDIMLMDRDSWIRIRGYPENEFWVHSDLIVCKVVHNNGLIVRVPLKSRAFTFTQAERACSGMHASELQNAEKYYDCVVCNPRPYTPTSF